MQNTSYVVNAVEGQMGTKRLIKRRGELQGLTRDSLIELVLQLEQRLSGSTDPFLQPSALRPFDLALEWQARKYIRLPAISPEAGDEAAQAAWRVALISFDLAHPVIGLELHADVVIGRASKTAEPGSAPDLDLSALDAERYGVSRLHAVLRPAEHTLQLIDLASTNGTRRNGMKLVKFEPATLASNDEILFGGLKFQIRIEDVAS